MAGRVPAMATSKVAVLGPGSPPAAPAGMTGSTFLLEKSMPAIPIDGPAVEPVGASEMRDYLRLDDGAEDVLLAALIRAARLAVEAASGRVLIDSRWRVQRDGWPADGVILLPVSPLIAVERVRVVGPDGEVADLPAGLYDADLASDPPRLIFDPRAPEPGPAGGGVL